MNTDARALIHIGFYVLSFGLSSALLVRALVNSGSWIAPRVKLALGILGVLGILWTALGIQARWPFLEVKPQHEFLFSWAKTFITGAAAGILGTLMLLRKLNLSPSGRNANERKGD